MVALAYLPLSLLFSSSCGSLVRAARAAERLTFFFLEGGCWGKGREGRDLVAASPPTLTVMFAVNCGCMMDLGSLICALVATASSRRRPFLALDLCFCAMAASDVSALPVESPLLRIGSRPLAFSLSSTGSLRRSPPCGVCREPTLRDMIVGLPCRCRC